MYWQNRRCSADLLISKTDIWSLCLYEHFCLLCAQLMFSLWCGRPGCQLEPTVKNLEVNELWLWALVSNESWQWWLNRVTQHTTRLTWLWARRESNQDDGDEDEDYRRKAVALTKALVHKTCCQNSLSVTGISVSAVWYPHGGSEEDGGVKALQQSFSDGAWEVASAAVDSLLVINDGVPDSAAAFPPEQQQLSQWQPWCCCPPPCVAVTQVWMQSICSHMAGYPAPPSQPPTGGHQTGELLAVFPVTVIQLVSSQTLFCLWFPSNPWHNPLCRTGDVAQLMIILFCFVSGHGCLLPR